MKLLTILAASVMCTACAIPVKEQTIEGIKEATKANIEASTRTYNKTPTEIQEASVKVFQLVDKPDFKFDIQGNDLLATRFSTFYAVFSFGFGRDWYSVNIMSDKSKSVVRYASYGEMLGGFPSPIPESFRTSIPIGSQANPADAELFHDRLSYMLGIKKDWVTCDQARARQKDSNRKIDLCDNLGIEDLSPGTTP